MKHYFLSAPCFELIDFMAVSDCFLFKDGTFFGFASV